MTAAPDFASISAGSDALRDAVEEQLALFAESLDAMIADLPEPLATQLAEKRERLLFRERCRLNQTMTEAAAAVARGDDRPRRPHLHLVETPHHLDVDEGDPD